MMICSDNVDMYNDMLLKRLSWFLNINADFIRPSDVKELTDECGITEEYAVALLLAGAMDMDVYGDPGDRELFHACFPDMVKLLHAGDYTQDPYYAEIRLPEKSHGTWHLGNKSFKPYELFVSDDMTYGADGLLRPKLGFFSEEFQFPAVTENGVLWMMVTPSEINTMSRDIALARGKVLTYGLGLGYYPFMALQRADVSSVTVVERDENVIALFNEYILPQFPRKQHVRIIHQDAFDYAEHSMGAECYDVVYTDIWHDAGDGLPLYRRMKECEKYSPDSLFTYWLEPTIKCYMD